MGTRSRIRFRRTKDAPPTADFYQQYDGYPDGVGIELAKFLLKREMVQGLTRSHPPRMSISDNTSEVELANTNELIEANGIGCLAAQYCAEVKKGPGNFYIWFDCPEQEWNYDVIGDIGPLKVSVNGGKEMNLEEFLAYCTQ